MRSDNISTKKQRRKGKLYALLVCATLIGAAFPTIQSVTHTTAVHADSKVKAAEYSTEDHQTLLASIIYSRSKGKSSDSVSVSLDQISLYPTYEKQGNKSLVVYGDMLDPRWGETQSAIGRHVASKIKTLYSYHYLVSDSTEKNILENIWSNIAGLFATTGRAVALGGAFIGATAFDLATTLIDFIVLTLKYMDLTRALGFKTGLQKADSFVNSIILAISKSTRLDASFLNLVKNAFYIVTLGTFVVALIRQLRKNNSRKIQTTFQKYGMRILTYVMTIPMMAMIYDVGSKSFDTASEFTSITKSFTSDYMVDVVDWAGTMNLSLDPISASQSGDYKHANPAFKPTEENIKKLNAAINAKQISVVDDKEKAADKILKLMNDSKVSVQQYFNYIAASKDNTQLAAAYYNKKQNAFPQQTYLLVKTESDENSTENAKQTYGEDSADTSSGSTKSEDPVNVKTTLDIGDVQFKIGSSSIYNPSPAIWNEPSSYIYGATSAGNLTETTVNHGNYHASKNTDMLNDPNTGKAASDDKKKEALVTNYRNFIQVNKYAGVTGSSTGFSTQSTAFLLQSTFDNNTLVYKGFNTAANKEGSSKNTGQYGAKFSRYVIPYTTDFDLAGKYAKVGTVWIVTGAISVVVLLALIKAPLFTGILRHLAGFMKALLFGDPIAFMISVVYYLALCSTAIFSYFAVAVCGAISDIILNLPIVSILADAASIIPIAGSVAIAVGLGYAFMWPVVTWNIGSSNKTKKVGFAEVIVSAPFLIAEGAEEWLHRVAHRITGTQRGSSLIDNALKKGNFKTIDPKKELQKGAKKVLNAGVGAARMMAGDVTGAAQIAGALAEDEAKDPNAIDKSKGLLGTVGAAAVGAVAGKEGGKLIEGAADKLLKQDSNEEQDLNSPKKDISLLETDVHNENEDEILQDNEALTRESSIAPTDLNDVDQELAREQVEAEKQDDIEREITEEQRDNQTLDELRKIREAIDNEDEHLRDESIIDSAQSQDSEDKPVMPEVQDAKVSLADDTVEVTNSELEISNPDLEVKDAEINLADNTVEVTDPDLEVKDAEVNLANDTVEVTNSELEVANPDLEVKDAEVNLANDAVEVTNPELEVKNTEVNLANDSVEVTNPELEVKASDVNIDGDNTSLNGNSSESTSLDDKIAQILKSRQESGNNELDSKLANLENSFKTKFETPLNAVQSGVRHASDTVKNSGTYQDIADAIQSKITGKPVEQVKIERSQERNDLTERIIERTNSNHTTTQIHNNNESHKRVETHHLYEANKIINDNSDSDLIRAISPVLSGIQTATQKVASSPILDNKIVKTVGGGARNIVAGTVDKALFDGEEVLGKALKGQKIEIEDKRNNLKPNNRSTSAIEEVKLRRQNEELKDSILDLTDELRRSNNN